MSGGKKNEEEKSMAMNHHFGEARLLFEVKSGELQH